MQKDKTVALITILLIIAFACSIGLFWIKVSPFKKGRPEIGKPFYNEKVKLYWGELSDYLICGDHLILLFDEKNAIQFYSLSGSPMFSFEFCFRNNGRSHLHTDGKKLIVEDRQHNYYLFSEKGVFEEYISDKKRKEELSNTFFSTTEARTTGDGSIYELKGASIYNTSSDETKVIISRPFFMVIFQGPRILFLALIIAVILCVWFKTTKMRP